MKSQLYARASNSSATVGMSSPAFCDLTWICSSLTLTRFGGQATITIEHFVPTTHYLLLFLFQWSYPFASSPMKSSGACIGSRAGGAHAPATRRRAVKHLSLTVLPFRLLVSLFLFTGSLFCFTQGVHPRPTHRTSLGARKTEQFRILLLLFPIFDSLPPREVQNDHCEQDKADG